MEPITLSLSAAALSALGASTLLYVSTRRRLDRGWRSLASETDRFALRLREARIRPAKGEEEPDLAWRGYRSLTREIPY